MSHFGYKDHINIDREHGLIRHYVVTDASVHDSQALAGLLDGESKVRAKVEHVFGNWVMQQGGKLLCCIGLARATAQLGLKNLTYNLKRFIFWESQLENV